MDLTQDFRFHLKQSSVSSVCLICRAPVILGDFEPRFQASVQRGTTSPPKTFVGVANFKSVWHMTIFFSILPFIREHCPIMLLLQFLMLKQNRLFLRILARQRLFRMTLCTLRQISVCGRQIFPTGVNFVTIRTFLPAMLG